MNDKGWWEDDGWGTWIRTRVARVRAESSTAKLSPNGIHAGYTSIASAALCSLLTAGISTAFGFFAL